MPELRGDAARVDLGKGYALRAPGLLGRAERHDGGPAGAAATRARERSTPLLDALLARTEMADVATVEIDARRAPGGAAGGAAATRDAHGQDALVLEVPDPGPNAEQVVLQVDEAGALTWHFAEDVGAGRAEPAEGVVRGGAGGRRFVIRRDAPSAPPNADAGAERALFGALGRKVLKVLVYPVTDRLIGKPAAFVAEKWESANRAYGLRRFEPGNYQSAPADSPDRHALGAAGAGRLAGGRALLWIHGTFSTAHGAFGDLPPELVAELDARYDGRMVALDHFSLSHDPVRNVRWLLDELARLAPDARLEVDVVCHSRGGLVARALAEGAGGLDTGRVAVRRVAMAGVPNAGTALARPDHMTDLIDRLTTVLNKAPPGGVADWLEGILIAVKVLGHGALKGLEGLRAMDPDAPFLKALNQRAAAGAAPRATEYFAIAANYEPADPGLRGVVSRGKDLLADAAFGGADNDLVVPEAGVYDANGCDAFPVAAERCLRLDRQKGVNHTGMFGHPDVQKRLLEWLQ